MTVWEAFKKAGMTKTLKRKPRFLGIHQGKWVAHNHKSEWMFLEDGDLVKPENLINEPVEEHLVILPPEVAQVVR